MQVSVDRKTILGSYVRFCSASYPVPVFILRTSQFAYNSMMTHFTTVHSVDSVLCLLRDVRQHVAPLILSLLILGAPTPIASYADVQDADVLLLMGRIIISIVMLLLIYAQVHDTVTGTRYPAPHHA